MTPERSLYVLVASDDRNFVRFARSVLSTGGHRVHTSTVRPERLQRLIRLSQPDVLVLDGDDEAVTRSRVAFAHSGLALLRAIEDPPGGVVREDRSTVAKWGPASQLLACVEAAAHRAGGPRRARDVSDPPELRLIGP